MGTVHLITGDLKLCKSSWRVCVLAIISTWENGSNYNLYPCASSLVDCRHGTTHNPAPLKVSMCTFYVPAIHSWTHSRHSVPGLKGTSTRMSTLGSRWCQGGGDNKVFIPMGMNVQTVVAAHPPGATQPLAVMGQMYFSWSRKWI